MYINDIRFMIFNKLDIKDLKTCFCLDHLSNHINNHYFWDTYYKNHDIIIPLIKFNYYKGYEVACKTKTIINLFKKDDNIEVLHIELKNMIPDIFTNDINNLSLKHFLRYKIESPFFYELRIIKNNDSFNFFCVIIEFCYEGIKRGYESLDITIKKDDVYNAIFKLIYNNLVNDVKYYIY